MASWYDSFVAFVRWDPLRDLLAIQQRLERYAPSQAGWRPPVDLQETDDRYLVTAELPGVKQEDIHVAFQGGVLTLSGMGFSSPLAVHDDGADKVKMIIILFGL